MNVVIEELKQRITAIEAKVRRYQGRVDSYIPSQYPSWIQPGKFPGENLFRKITPRRKTFGFFTSATIVHNLFHPGKKCPNIDSPQWIFEFHPMSFDITPVIFLILFGVWQYLTGITTMRGNSSSRNLG